MASLTDPSISKSLSACQENHVKTKPFRVLVVDDDEDIQLITGMVLRRLGSKVGPIVVEKAFSAKEAIRRLDNPSPTINLLLLDLVMESQDAGFQVIQHLNSFKKDVTPKVIIRTGQGHFENPNEDHLPSFVISRFNKTELGGPQLRNLVLEALEPTD